MSDLINALIGLVVGLVTGVLSGYYFERRATRTAERDAAELRGQLKALRESIYSTRSSPEVVPSLSRSPMSTPVLLEWLRIHQDGSGSVMRHRVFDHFLVAGHRTNDIERALVSLSESGDVGIDHDLIRVTIK